MGIDERIDAIGRHPFRSRSRGRAGAIVARHATATRCRTWIERELRATG